MLKKDIITIVVVIVLGSFTGYGLSLPSAAERSALTDIEALRTEIVQLKKEIKLLSGESSQSGESTLGGQ